jgi:hypothetical protein
LLQSVLLSTSRMQHTRAGALTVSKFKRTVVDSITRHSGQGVPRCTLAKTVKVPEKSVRYFDQQIERLFCVTLRRRGEFTTVRLSTVCVVSDLSGLICGSKIGYEHTWSVATAQTTQYGVWRQVSGRIRRSRKRWQDPQLTSLFSLLMKGAVNACLGYRKARRARGPSC